MARPSMLLILVKSIAFEQNDHRNLSCLRIHPVRCFGLLAFLHERVAHAVGLLWSWTSPLGTSARGTPSASIGRISFVMSSGTVIVLSLFNSQ